MIRVLHLRDTQKVCGPGKTIIETCTRIDSGRFSLDIGLFMHREEETNLYREAAQARGIVVHPIRTSHPFDPRLVGNTIRLLKSGGYDIIHAHDYKSDLLAYLIRRVYPIPIMTTIHGWITNSWKTKAYIAVQKRLLRSFDRVIAVSPAIRRELLSKGVPEHRIALIYNAIVMENYREEAHPAGEFRRSLGLEARVPLVGNVGRLSPEKGQRDFLMAAARLPEQFSGTHFVLVGDGPDRSDLEGLCVELGIRDRVHFTGHLTDVRPVFRDLDLLALTSHTEGFPNVVLESLSMGTPVLATAVGGTPDIVHDGKSGILVSARDLDAIAAGLEKILSDHGFAEETVVAGRQMVEEKFQFSVRVEKVSALYEDLMEEWRGSRPAVGG